MLGLPQSDVFAVLLHESLFFPQQSGHLLIQTVNLEVLVFEDLHLFGY